MEWPDCRVINTQTHAAHTNGAHKLSQQTVITEPNNTMKCSHLQNTLENTYGNTHENTLEKTFILGTYFIKVAGLLLPKAEGLRIQYILKNAHIFKSRKKVVYMLFSGVIKLWYLSYYKYGFHTMVMFADKLTSLNSH